MNSNSSLKHTATKKATTALSGLNLTVKKGEIFGVIGHSGAGKSTLIRCINLLERPTEGEVWVGGVELTKLKRRELQQQRRKIGMIFQHFNLLSSATVYDNIAFPLKLMGVPKLQIAAKVNELLELVGLTQHQKNILHSCPEAKSSGSASPGRSPATLTCCSATKRRQPWIRRRRIPS